MGLIFIKKRGFFESHNFSSRILGYQLFFDILIFNILNIVLDPLLQLSNGTEIAAQSVDLSPSIDTRLNTAAGGVTSRSTPGSRPSA